MSVSVDRDQAFLDDGPPHRRRGRGAQRRRRRPRGALSRRDDRGAARGGGAVGVRPRWSSAAAASRFETIAAACFELGRRCGSSAMVFAMHQIQVVTIARHLDDAALVRGLPARRRRRAAADRLGHLRDRHRRRHGPLDRRRHARRRRQPARSRSRRRRSATAPRRRPVRHAAPRAPRPSRATRSWRSRAADQIDARADRHLGPAGHARNVLARLRRARRRSRPSRSCPTPFPRVMAESMVPVSHILWSHLWLGIATDAFDRARAFVRAAAKQKPGEPPPAALRLSHLMSELSLLRAEVGSALRGLRRGLGGAGSRAAVDDGLRAALQQPQDRRLRAGAAGLPGRARACAGSWATRTTRRSASGATCATRCPPA